MRKYTKLLDKAHKDEVVMSEGEKSYEYENVSFTIFYTKNRSAPRKS
jgi:hypothetical protein